MNLYYDVSIREYRLNEIKSMAVFHLESTWTFIVISILDRELVQKVFREYRPLIVVNLAAQVGIRYSITQTQMPISTFTTSWRLVAIPIMMGNWVWNIGCMLPLPVCTGSISPLQYRE